MKKNTLLFCTGISGTGKTYFIKNTLPKGLFYNLKSVTTRPMREGESQGNPYYFCTEDEFEHYELATKLFVNEAFWKKGQPKWLYGVTEQEIKEHIGLNLTYDVIQPKYVRQMIDWFRLHNLDRLYTFKIAYFIPQENDNLDTAKKRANMPNDIAVRTKNTCNPCDFVKEGLDVDYLNIATQNLISPKLLKHIQSLQQNIK
ncbi:MAG: hypothetical protein MJ156_01890 [Alphaproteobacteria bacterium]|nr:hypothetical protein [Alphaproteobacteria bacterium]